MASGARWRRLIEAKIFRTNGSSNGSPMGDAQSAFISERRVTLRWSPESIHDLSALRVHILEHDPAAVKPVALHILYCVEHLLSENPQLGHPPAALPEGGSLSFRKRPSSFPTAFGTMCSKSRAVSPRPPVAGRLLTAAATQLRAQYRRSLTSLNLSISKEIWHEHEFYHPLGIRGISGAKSSFGRKGRAKS
jgi:hypothetical protein